MSRLLIGLMFAALLAGIVARSGAAEGNTPPVAVDDSYSTPQDTPVQVDKPGLLVNDSDSDGDPIIAASPTTASHGYVVMDENGSFTYTPHFGFNGVDSFQYAVYDGTDFSTDATVTIKVGTGNIGNAPVGATDTYLIRRNRTLTVDSPGVLANDTDADGDPLTAIQVTWPMHGTADLNADGSFKYSPDPGFSGEDVFLYYPSDGTNLGSLVGVKIVVG